MRTILGVAVVVLLSGICAAQRAEFGVDPLSPEVPARSPLDIYESTGTSARVTATMLGLPSNVNIDAFSYGMDRIEPLGPRFYVTMLFSVDRQSKGRPGSIIALQEQGNGAAGDQFYIKARFVQGVGMIAISRGLFSDAPMHKLTPKGAGPRESNLDGMSYEIGEVPPTIYFSIDGATPVPGTNWDASDILRTDWDPATQRYKPARVWLRAAQMGLGVNPDIDALAVWNMDKSDTPNQGDIVYVSLRTPVNVTDRIEQVWPAPRTTIFTGAFLHLRPGDEIDAMTGVDPGPREKQEKKPPPRKEKPPAQR